MDSILAGRITRSDACRMVAPHVECCDLDASPLACDGALRIHGYDMGYRDDPRFLSHAKDDGTGLTWFFADGEVEESIRRWRHKVASARQDGPASWATWSRPVLDVSPPEMLAGLGKDRQRILPDGRVETYVAFLDGYDRGSGGKLELDGFPGWLASTGAGEAAAGRRWFDRFLTDGEADPAWSRSVDQTASVDDARIGRVRDLLTRYLAEKELVGD